MKPTSGPRILVIEDDTSIRATLIDILELNDFEVVSATNGPDGVTMARSHRPDVILTDISMPGFDGFELIRTLHDDEQTRAIPIIIVSASVEPEKMRAGMDLGAEDFIVKPFTEDQILGSIRARLEKKALLDELDAFAHTVAHDLKNPIAVVSMRAQLLRSLWNTADDAKLLQHVIELDKNTERLNSIVDELLLLAGVRRQKIVPKRIEMDGVVQESLGRVEHLIQQSQARVEKPAAWPAAMGHGPWAAEIWTNYLSNAVKYGGQPPVIQLGADAVPERGCVRFWVQDNGPGLTPEQQAALFQQFSRVTETRIKGHGLGLSIVRRITDKLGGSAGVESQVGAGSRFWFELPRRAMKILIVEDEAGIRDILKTVLELNGHEVLEAEDGVAGVALARQSPDFIFCDIRMPNLDGHGVLAAIKQMPEVCDVPFVFLTANADRAQQREGMALGADDYITKPFSERDILDAIAARTKRQLTARDRIQRLTDQHQREINAQWSHELLTPLNAVIGSLDLLETEADSIDRTELKEILAIIREGAVRQERLAQKLIRYFSLQQELNSRVPAGDHCRAVDAINAGAARAAAELKHAPDLSVSASSGDVGLGGERLRDAVYELVANALAFSNPGAPVTVNGAVQGGSYRIEVCDRGPGLTAEQRARVGAFTQFERQKREQQGLGLGLAIAQSSARLAGGSLVLEAGPDGSGLCAILSLPLVRDALPDG